MRLLYLGTSYPRNLEDWRGLFIHHLAHALARTPNLDMRIWAPPGEYPDNAEDAATPADQEWLTRLMADGGIAHLLRSRRIAGLWRAGGLVRRLHQVYGREQEIDLYHINWLQAALPLPDNGKPALITVLGSDLKLLGLPAMKSLLRRVLRHRAVAICPNAEWMQEPLEKHFGDLARIQAVPFGIDPIWYAIERKPESDIPIWLAVTRLTRDKLGTLLDWSPPLFGGQARQLHLFGPAQDRIDLPGWIHYHGPATPEQLARNWFPRAHGLITLSRHAEGRPQVMLEAMAAGLPIIASDMPAHAGIVTDDEIGRLCRTEGVYQQAVEELEDLVHNRRLGEAARAWVKEQIGTWDDCATSYTQLYRELLSHRDA